MWLLSASQPETSCWLVLSSSVSTVMDKQCIVWLMTSACCGTSHDALSTLHTPSPISCLPLTSYCRCCSARCLFLLKWISSSPQSSDCQRMLSFVTAVGNSVCAVKLSSSERFICPQSESFANIQTQAVRVACEIRANAVKSSVVKYLLVKNDGGPSEEDVASQSRSAPAEL